jgi:hypothetical protein
MTIPLLDEMVANWFAVFGGGSMLALICIGILFFVLLVIRAPKSALLIVIVPFITVIASTPTVYLQIARWVGVMVWVALGAIMAISLWAIMD